MVIFVVIFLYVINLYDDVFSSIICLNLCPAEPVFILFWKTVDPDQLASDNAT